MMPWEDQRGAGVRSFSSAPAQPWWLMAFGAVAVVLVDLGGALVSRTTGLTYGVFAIPSGLVYVAIGVLGIRRNSLLVTTCVASAVAIVDATLGCWIAVRVGVLHFSFETLADAFRVALMAKVVIAVQSLLTAVSGVATLHVMKARHKMRSR